MAAPVASAQTSAGTLAVVPAVGPVGTVVHLHGQVDSTCVPGGTVTVEFEAYGQTTTGGVDTITAAVTSDGSFTAEYQIPSDLGGAATRGLSAYPTSPGSYQFRYGGAGCSPSAVAAFALTGAAAPAPSSFVAMAPTPDGRGYWLAQAGGGVESYGDAQYRGSLPGLGVTPSAPISAMAATPDGKGYWLVGGDGGVYAFGDARYFGSLPGSGVTPAGSITSLAPTADGKGYWLLGADGGVFAFGDAAFAGAGTGWLGPFEAIGRAASGGYDLVTSHLGQIWRYPGGTRLTSVPSRAPIPLTASLSTAAATATGQGAWQVGLDGGVFAFGDAEYFGSLPEVGVTPVAPIVAVVPTPGADGYWLLGGDGGVFCFGDAGFYGSGA